MPKPICCITGLGYRDYDTERAIMDHAGIDLRLLDSETEDDVVRDASDAHALLVRHVPVTERIFSAQGPQHRRPLRDRLRQR